MRGTDTTGIAYNYGGKLRIYKRPLPTHKMKFRVPHGVNVILGHTRMTTQGSEKRNINNHPFSGKVPDRPFALAHNGMLWNDEELRKSEKLPFTPIETDSYIAVQLIEQQRALHFDSLKAMAEKVQGSFVFTVLDHEDSIWFVKGDNPLHIFCYDGYLLYASTEEILIRTERRLKIRRHSTIDIGEGEILKIDRHGKQSRGTFIMQHTFEHFWRSYPYYGRQAAFESCLMDEPQTLENLFATAKHFGFVSLGYTLMT